MTMHFDPNEPLWVERYRPSTVEDCILQPSVKREAAAMVKQGVIPNLLFHGPAGCGKTTLAKALCKENGVDWMLINGSNERGIDVIRHKIVEFASTTSLSGKAQKCVIIDESDRLTPEAQDALKTEIENFSTDCSFILTANHPNRIIAPLLSRCTGIDFAPKKGEVEQMQALVFDRVCKVLDNEKITYDEAVLVNIVQRFFPDTRRILGELQKYSMGSGEINEGLLMNIQEANVDRLIEALKSKKFKTVLQWAADNASMDSSVMYGQLYNELRTMIDPKSFFEAILIIEDYQRH